MDWCTFQHRPDELMMMISTGLHIYDDIQWKHFPCPNFYITFIFNKSPFVEQTVRKTNRRKYIFHYLNDATQVPLGDDMRCVFGVQKKVHLCLNFDLSKEWSFCQVLCCRKDRSKEICIS